MRSRLALLLVVLAVVLALPAVSAPAQDANPFDGLPPVQATPVPTVEPAQTDDGQTGRTTLYVIAGGLVVAFIGIGWWISRDARSVLPPERRREAENLREQGPHRHERKAKARAREKARRARAARKANQRRAKR